MLVAALYDVHGNVHALDAVLAEVGDADVVLFGGDIATGPFPNETLERVRSLPHALCIRGNAEELEPQEWMTDVQLETRRWMHERLSPADIASLAGLPFSWSADETLYVHANPVDFGFVLPGTPDEVVRELARGVEERQIVTGHVHVQFERELDGLRWVGVGSVGCPYVDDPVAQWALVDGGRVELRTTEYDVEGADAAIAASGYPGAGFAAVRAQGAGWVAGAR